jgi:minor extracellular serine protease Vpr
MQRRATFRTVLTVLAVFGAMVLPQTAGASASTSQRFHRLATGAPTKFVPNVAQGGRLVKVIVQLKGTTVGARVAKAHAKGKNLSQTKRRTFRSQVRNSQRPLRSLVAKRGGTVLASYQDAYNGVAVKIKQRDVAALAKAPGVASVHPVRVLKRNTVPGVQYIGGNQAWQKGPDLTGAGVKIGIIDTGIDYTHADFGGAGTPEAFAANNPTVIEPGSFPTARVAGGKDFVGDAYAAEDPAHDVPAPDPDPLDCNGHGSHVAGIAAGNGVLADGSAYTGPYNSTTYSHSFSVGPGVAPKAKLYAYKVFGCEGSVENSIVIDALNQAAVDDVDVINMSLGSPYGSPDDPETQAVDTLVKAGISVVASAGNSGTNAYLTGSPASANRAISVAALDASRATVPGAHAVFSNTTGTVDLQDSNEAPIPSGALPVKVLKNADGTVALGCDQADYAGTAGQVVVTKRGTCARAARAVFGQRAGSAAVIMINTDAAYPPMEGKITENPDNGDKEDVTIPFFGATGTAAVTTTLLAADGGTVTLTPIDIANPGYQNLASFTSGGPRTGDSAVKPDVTAPGVAVNSAGVGTGFKPATISGTSQASPFTAGTAALVRQAHPSWSPEKVKAAIMNTADPSLDKDYQVRLAGAGVVQAQRAVDTKGLILAGAGQSTLSYGAEALERSYHETLTMTVVNTGTSSTTYNIAGSFVGDALGMRISASPSRVRVDAGRSEKVKVTLSLSGSGVANLPAAEASNFGELVSVAGAVVATPTTSGAGKYALRVPFLVAPRGVSDVSVSDASTPRRSSPDTTSVRLANRGIHQGNADFYAWGISDPRDSDPGYTDVRAVGVQSLPGSALDPSVPDTDRALIFAVNMHKKWSNVAQQEIDIPLDRNGDGKPDAYVVGIDYGFFTTGEFDGRFAALTTDGKFNVIDVWVADGPMNGSTVELPALASELGVTPTASAFDYAVATFDPFTEGADDTDAATFDAFAPAVSTGDFVALDPGDRHTQSLTFDRAKAKSTGAKGWMVVTLDDPSGSEQADLVRLPRR